MTQEFCLKPGDELISKFYIHEQLHMGASLTKIDPNDNIGLFIRRRGTIKFYRMSDYLTEVDP